MSIFELMTMAAVGGTVTFLLIPLIIRFSRSPETADGLREIHHTHQAPVPRLGGVALAAAFVVVALIATVLCGARTFTHTVQFTIVIGAVAMFLLGLADDLNPLGANKKLIFQILIASGVYALGVRIELFKDPITGNVFQLGMWSGLVTVLWLVAFTNLINLIDGADGLAGGISLMLMSLLAYAGLGREFVGLIAAGMVGALLGFLKYNFPPARIYMGDGGAYFLGFLMGMLSIMTSQKGTLAAALIAPLFVLALPIMDTTVAIIRRWLRGLPLFRPDRRHLHHRLADMGYSRRRVTLTIYGFTALFLAMGIAVFWSQGRWFPIMLGCLGLTLLTGSRMLDFTRQWYSVGRVLGNSLEMRREVQYVVTLMRWFELEGDRAKSVDPLWDDFILISRKLNFSHARLTLGTTRYEWESAEHDPADPTTRTVRHPLHNGKPGQLELTSGPECNSEVERDLFDILAELAAEGWQKALRRKERAKAAEQKLVAADGTRETRSCAVIGEG